MPTPVLRVGILGATDALEYTFLPILHSLSTLFDIKIIHSQNDTGAAERCQKEFSIPYAARSADEVLRHPEVDLVLNLLPFEYHEKYTIAALEAGKHVMVDVPLSLSIHSLRRIHAASKKGSAPNKAPKVFVGCARRYAPCYTDVFKKELASLDRIQYARCRNIAGLVSLDPAENPAVQQNGHANGAKENQKLNGHEPKAASGLHLNGLDSDNQLHSLMVDIFGSTDDITPDRVAFCRFLGTLGCHDLSLMRDSLGFPDAVANVSITDPFYSTIFHYTNPSTSLAPEQGNRHPFTVMYETGVNAVPGNDAHMTVYGAKKTISIEYDIPGSPQSLCKKGSVLVTVEEAESGAQSDGPLDKPGSMVKRTEFRSTFAEAYERQFLELHSYLAGGVEAKTSTGDALMDLRLLNMVFDHYNRQCGTIRTPLG